MNVNVSNKIVVITGSSRGIGSELAIAFAKEKAIVVINYLNSKEKANNIYKQVIKYSPRSIMVKADVSNENEVCNFYKRVIDTFGKIDVLINNAGICNDDIVNMMSMEQWKKVIDVNLTGTFLCCKYFAKSMIKQRKGKIINIASLKGQEGSIGQANYSSSKAGVIALSKSFAKEIGKYNVLINVVCPSFISTDLNASNSRKKEIAINKSILSLNYGLSDLISFIIFMSSDLLLGTSGRVFNLDSRIC